MAAYTTWAKVQQLYPRADDVESDSDNQTALITAKSNLFHSFIRNIHKNDLTSPYDEPVKEAVALLVIDELRRRAQTDDDERGVEVTYPHYAGLTSQEGAGAHAVINSIRMGALVLTEDLAEHDIHRPEATADSGNTGAGTVEVYLPHEYKSNRSDSFVVEIETTGRVDDSTATFKFNMGNNATALGEGVTCSEGWLHLKNECYIRFVDAALTGDSFTDGDKWTFTCVPTTTDGMASGPSQFEVYLG